jgi:PAS domain-containing protein
MHAKAADDPAPDPAPARALLAAVEQVREQLDGARERLVELEDRLARVRERAEAAAGPAGAGQPGMPSAGRPDSAGVADAEWDLTEDRVVWSAEMFRIFGRDRDLGPLTLDQLPAHLHDDDRPGLSRALTAALVDGKPVDTWFRVTRPDGTLCAVHCAGAPEQEADGVVRSIRLDVRDVTAELDQRGHGSDGSDRPQTD